MYSDHISAEMMGVHKQWDEKFVEMWDPGHALEIAVKHVFDNNKLVKNTIDTISSFIDFMGMGKL